MRKAIVTGAAGFIGYFMCHRLLDDGYQVLGVDSLDAYYDVSLKRARVVGLSQRTGFRFVHQDLADPIATTALVAEAQPHVLVHLAAQAGVRYSLANPRAYIDSNVVAFLNVLEACRNSPVEHLVFASSSSVYGGNRKVPFSVEDNVDHPVSLYAATKKADELMAHAYSHLFGIPITALRFFTVYGPWGRPDMAPMLFTKALLAGDPIKVFNNGDLKRDFTYVGDIVEGVRRVIDAPPPPRDLELEGKVASNARYRIFNIGSSAPVDLMHFIETLASIVGRPARLEYLPMQPGDVYATFADISDLEREFGYRPRTPLEQGLRELVAWYREFYRIGP